MTGSDRVFWLCVKVFELNIDQRIYEGKFPNHYGFDDFSCFKTYPSKFILENLDLIYFSGWRADHIGPVYQWSDCWGVQKEGWFDFKCRFKKLWSRLKGWDFYACIVPCDFFVYRVKHQGIWPNRLPCSTARPGCWFIDVSWIVVSLIGWIF